MNEVSSSSFEFYEGLRILVPGGLFVGLYVAVSETFGLGGAVTVGNALVAVLATLAVGLVLLFLDIPSKAAVFFYNAPEPYLRSWTDLSPPRGTSHLTVYYQIMDVEVPAGIRNSIYYLGTMYRIGFESVYVAAASMPVLVVAVLFPSVGAERGDNSTGAIRWLFAIGLLLHATVIATALWDRHRQHRRKEPRDAPGTGRQRWSSVARDLMREIPPLDRLLLASGVVALILNLAYGWRWAGVVSVAAPGVVWAIRYVYGVRASRADGQRYRQNLHAVTAAVLFGVASTSLCVLGVRHAVSDSPLNAGVVVAWLAATLIGAALITERAHEKRLLGSYLSQRAWLDRNREMLVEKGYLVRRQTGE